MRHCVNLIDLDAEQPQRQASEGSVDAFESLDTGVGAILSTPLCRLLPPPPCPWLHVEVRHHGDVLGVQLVASPRPHDHFQCRRCRRKVWRLHHRQRFVLRVLKAVASESEAPCQLSWVEKVELEEAEMLDLPSPSENLEGVQGLAMAPPCSAPVLGVSFGPSMSSRL